MGIEIKKDWRKHELSLSEVIEKHKDISKFNIIKTDVQRRGGTFTKAAIDAVDLNVHHINMHAYAADKTILPESFLLRDGTSVVTSFTDTVNDREPYIIDVVDGKTVLIDEGKVIEEIIYWEKPDYFDKFTSSGKPMWQIVGARPQRFDIFPNKNCHFWDKPGNGCKYCNLCATYHKSKEKIPEHLDIQDISETVEELLKEKGRYVSVVITGGSVLSGKEIFDDELEYYIKVINAVGQHFNTKRFPCQLNGSAFNERQLERLYNETGITYYTTDLEVFDEEKFNWICPGKAELVGFSEWKNRLYKAVEIFGKGNVNTGIVSGVELAKPYGFKTEEDAIKAAIEQGEELASHGVGLKHDVWRVAPGSVFFNQSTPSLDYYVSITKGFDKIVRKYNISVDMDSYRRCGNHPNTDLGRI